MENKSAFTFKSLALLLALLCLAGVLKFRYLNAYEEREPLADAPYGDSLVYLDEVERHFRYQDRAVFYKPPIYTALLALFAGDTPEGRHRMRLFQLVLGLGMLACLFLLAHARAGLWAGVIAFLLTLFYGPITFHETKLLDTTVALFLLVASCTLLDRHLRRPGWVPALCTGLLLGLATLSRTANLVLALAVVLALLYRKEARNSLVLLAGTLLAVLPVTLYNFRVDHEIIPVNYSEGHTFLVGNNPYAKGIFTLPPGYSDGVLNERLQEELFARQKLGRDPTPGEQRDISYKEGLRFLRENPSAVPGLLFAKFRFALSSHEISDNYSFPRERKKLGLLAPFVIPFALLLMLGLFGLAAGRLGPAAPVILPLIITAAILLAFYVTSRYRLPLTPFLAVCSGVGLATVIRKSTRPARWRIKLGAGLVVVIAILLAATETPYSDEDINSSEETFQAILDLHAAAAKEQAP